MLFDIPLRFRLPKIALIGDLEKAFLNVEVKPEDRNLLRFLWIDYVNSLNPGIIKLRFTRLVFGLVCFPFILNVTLRNHLSKYENADPEFVSTVIKALYVDDFASGKNTVMDCFELYQKLTRFREGGFNMRNWASNGSEFNELIKKEETTLLSGKPAVEPTKSVETATIDQPKSTNRNTMSEETVVKVMGVMWDKSEDCFKFDFSAFSKQTLSGTLTKRKLLSVTALFYDPLGLLSPLILPFKCMFQEICQLKVEWDKALPEDLTSRWKELVEDIEGAPSFTISRCIMDGIEAEQVKCIQLHRFADASRIAYGANV